MRLSTATYSRRVCTRWLFRTFDESSISALVDVVGSTFATIPNKFVTFSSGTLVFVFAVAVEYLVEIVVVALNLIEM